MSCKVLATFVNTVNGDRSQLICVFVFAHSKSRFAHDTAHMFVYCRLNQVFAKFDEVKMSGNMLATADLGKFVSSC